MLHQSWRHDQTGSLVSELEKFRAPTHGDIVQFNHSAKITQTWTPKTHGLPDELKHLQGPPIGHGDAHESWSLGQHGLPAELGGLMRPPPVQPSLPTPPPQSSLPASLSWDPTKHLLPSELGHLMRPTPTSEIGTDNTWQSRHLLPSELTQHVNSSYEAPIAFMMAQRKDLPLGFGLFSGQDKVYATGPKFKADKQGGIVAHPEKLITPETNRLFPKSYDLLHNSEPLRYENRVGNVVNPTPNIDLSKLLAKQRQLYNVVGVENDGVTPVLGYSGPTGRPMQTLDERSFLQRNFRTLIDQNSFGRSAQPFVNVAQQTTFIGNVNRS